MRWESTRAPYRPACVSISILLPSARGLGAWAQGHYPTEAAVDFLVRAKGGRFARETQPWIKPREQSALYRCDWGRLHDELGVLSGGERTLPQRRHLSRLGRPPGRSGRQPQ